MITVVVLAALFTAADRIAVHYADKEAARLAKEKYGYAHTTDGHMTVAIEGFPFLTQAIDGDFSHVALNAAKFSLDTTGNTQGGYLNVSRLHLDMHDVKVTSLTARRAEANLVTGTLTRRVSASPRPAPPRMASLRYPDEAAHDRLVAQVRRLAERQQAGRPSARRHVPAGRRRGAGPQTGLGHGRGHQHLEREPPDTGEAPWNQPRTAVGKSESRGHGERTRGQRWPRKTRPSGSLPG